MTALLSRGKYAFFTLNFSNKENAMNILATNGVSSYTQR